MADIQSWLQHHRLWILWAATLGFLGLLAAFVRWKWKTALQRWNEAQATLRRQETRMEASLQVGEAQRPPPPDPKPEG